MARLYLERGGFEVVLKSRLTNERSRTAFLSHLLKGNQPAFFLQIREYGCISLFLPVEAKEGLGVDGKIFETTLPSRD